MALAVTSTPEVGAAPLLSVEGLSVRFGAFLALDHVDVEIHSGETVALGGENGAGKSTLVGLIGLDAATQYVITALVLLAAVTVDAVARRGRMA